MLGIVRDQKGQSTVLVVGAMVALLGFAALAVDMGMLYFNRAKLVNIADAAALAGAQKLPDRPSPDTAVDTAIAVAGRFATSNGKIATDTWIATVGTTTFTNDTMNVTVTRNIPLFFARVLGMESTPVTARAAAQVVPVSSATGVVPIGVETQPFVYNEEYTLKLGSSKDTIVGRKGNFGALALGNNGANTYNDNLINGYKGDLALSDTADLIVSTETGDIVGPTDDAVAARVGLDPGASSTTVRPTSSRVVILPVIANKDNNNIPIDWGGKTKVEIIGFAAFFLEATENKGQIKGRFLEMVNVPGTSTDGAMVPDFGVRVLRLIR